MFFQFAVFKKHFSDVAFPISLFQKVQMGFGSKCSGKQEQDPAVSTGTACPWLTCSFRPRQEQTLRAAGTYGPPRDPRAAFPVGSGFKVFTQEEAGEFPATLLLLAAQVPCLSGGRTAGAGAAAAPGRAVPAPGCPAGGDRGRCSAAAAAEGTEALFSPVNKGTIAAPPGHCSPPV